MSEKEKLLQQSGKYYRNHWSGFFILCCQVILPMLIGGLLQHFIVEKDDLLNSALPTYAFFLPLMVLSVILNLFIGRIIAVFGEKGFYALKEVELSQWNAFENKEKMIFIPYDKIQRIQYKPTTKNRPNHKSDYSAVEVTYVYTDASGQNFTDICVLRCGAFTRAARDFAKMIRKKSGRAIPVESDKVSRYIFTGIVIAAYVFLFAVSW